MAAVAFSLKISGAEEYTPVEVVEDCYFVMLLKFHSSVTLL